LDFGWDAFKNSKSLRFFVMMKERYFSLSTIDVQASEFLKRLMEFRKKHEFKLDKRRAALLVIDMQEFFINEKSRAFIPSMPAIIPKVSRLQNYFLKNNLVAIQTKHVDSLEDGDQMGRWWHDESTLSWDGPISEITRGLIEPRIPVLQKTQYDAFWQTDLQQQLKSQGINQVVITGVMTHLCCETTARAAFIRGFEVFFAVDGTATYCKNFHFGSLFNLSHGFAVPVLCEEVIQIMEDRKDAS